MPGLKIAPKLQSALPPKKTPFSFYLFMGSVGVSVLAMIISLLFM